MSKQPLTKAPSLKIVGDAHAASKLRELLKDADDGFRRVVKVGLYIEWLAANLPHGQLMPWVATYAPEVAERTIYRWRTMAKNLCDWSGLKFANLANLEVPAEKLLDLPVADLPEKLQKARAKMEEVLDSARTPKQLFLDIGFKQGDLDHAGYPKAKKGRRKGEGGATKDQRAAAAAAEEQARIDEMELTVADFNKFMDAVSDAKGLPLISADALQKHWDRLKPYYQFVAGLMKAEKGAGR